MSAIQGLLNKYVTIHFTSAARGQHAREVEGEVYPYRDISGWIIDCDDVGLLIAQQEWGFKNPNNGTVCHTLRIRDFVPWSSIFYVTVDIETEAPSDREAEIGLELRAIDAIRHIAHARGSFEAVRYAQRWLKRHSDDALKEWAAAEEASAEERSE